ncbi:MAG: DNA-directed RNA polymerase subunit L [Candidatus Aenigmarchaeota archaeon]|nr:DNA-directed RNA polymerase subunit L [Candidatus Aenigmarchaeota archaeon]
MEIKVLEKTNESLKIEVIDETHTLLNLLREKAWKSGASQASYMIEHPYLSNPKISIKAKNPKKVLSDAAQMVADDAREFGKEFSRVVKK